MPSGKRLMLSVSGLHDDDRRRNAPGVFRKTYEVSCLHLACFKSSPHEFKNNDKRGYVPFSERIEIGDKLEVLPP